MTYVLTLTSATIDAFPVEAADAVVEALEAMGFSPRRPNWLGPAACDLTFDTGSLANAEAAARPALGAAEIDVIAQEVATRVASGCLSPTWNRP